MNAEITSPYLLREPLEMALNRRSLAGVSLRVAFVPPDKFELRIEAGSRKWIMPIFWVPGPISVQALRQVGALATQYFVACPRISDYVAEELMAVPGISHGDLNGRLFLQQEDLWILRDPVSDEVRNPPQKASPYSEKASRIPRILLSRPGHAWSQPELQDATATSRGYVSRVLKPLVDAGQVRKQGSGGPGYGFRYQVTDVDGILSDWEQRDAFSRRVGVLEYQVPDSDPERLAARVRDMLEGIPFAFTQWIAAWLRYPRIKPPVVSVYVTPRVLERFQIGKRVAKDGNLCLLVPKDEGVFQGMQTVNGFPLVSDAQMYLDLIGMGPRGLDAARELRAWEGFGGQDCGD